MDLLIVTAAYAVTYLGARLLGSSYAGLCALLACLAVATWRLAAAQSSWRDLGFRVPGNWLRTTLWSLALLVATALVGALIINPLARAAQWPPMDLSRVAGLRGNWHALMAWLLLAWTSAALAEELVFRAFLISRLQMIFGSAPLGTALTVLIQAVCFGAAHFYLGQRGVATAMAVGILYGATYLRSGRNLPALMLAHGTTDSLSLVALYFGAAAG
jgi:membrane protease YdiL (CAAX protease family)